MDSEREKRSLAWGVGAGGAAAILTAITLPTITCSDASALSCKEEPNYHAGAIVGLAAGLLALIVTHR